MINHSLTLGLKIECAEIDGVSIPIPKPFLTLVNQNSEYFQGTLPTTQLQATFPLAGEFAFRFRNRTTHEDYEPLSFNRRSISKAVRPIFAFITCEQYDQWNIPFLP